MHILDLGLQFVRVFLGDPPAEDHGELVGAADVTVGIQQPFPQCIQPRATAEDQIIAIGLPRGIWLANQMEQVGIRFQQSENAFRRRSDPEALQKIADSLQGRSPWLVIEPRRIE